MKISYEDKKKFLQALGKKIKEERKRKGLTQEDMEGSPYPIHYKYYQSIEYGQRNITMSTLLKICKKLDIHPKDLLDFDI